MKKYWLIILILSLTLTRADQPVEFRAIKLTNVDSNVLFSYENIAKAMDFLASININTVLVVVWNSNSYNGDYTLYPSAVMDSLFDLPIGPIGGSVPDPLDRVLIEAHRNGIEVLPWFEMGFATSWGSSYSSTPDHILNRYPHWALRNKDGKITFKNGFFWMSAINPEVQDFIRALAVEVAQNYDIDGIEYSDRIPAMPVEGGYDEATVAIYRSEHDGTEPPQNPSDENWKRWRADKMSAWYQTVRDTIKAINPQLHFSSSPSVYRWCYDNYLQDPPTWLTNTICDDVIPQLYRYSLTDYLYTLDMSIANYPGNRHRYFAGILMNIEYGPGGVPYVVSPENLTAMLQANRDRDVMGEAFFFYEGLRKNNNLLGNTLKATFYSEPALLPHRNGQIWRPKAIIVNEDDPGAAITGTWIHYTTTSYGFTPNILIKKDTLYAAVRYTFDVPYDAWYDVFAFIVSTPSASTQTPFIIYGGQDSTLHLINQKDSKNRGWQRLRSVYLTAGVHEVLKVDNRNAGCTSSGNWVIADAAMIMINRRLSPDVVITSIDDKYTDAPSRKATLPTMISNYPNPFNAVTTIAFTLAQPAVLHLRIIDLTGREVIDLGRQSFQSGRHTIPLHAGNLATGVYFCRFETSDNRNSYSFHHKLVLLK